MAVSKIPHCEPGDQHDPGKNQLDLSLVMDQIKNLKNQQKVMEQRVLYAV